MQIMEVKLWKKIYLIATLLAVLSFTGCAKQPKPVIPVELFEASYVAYNDDRDNFIATYYYNVVHEDEAQTLGKYAYNNIELLSNSLKLSEVRNGFVITFNALELSEIIVKNKENVLYADVVVTSENIISRAYGK